MKKGSTFALAFENKGRQTDKLSSSRRAKKSSLTDWNKVRNKTRQRGGRNHLKTNQDLSRQAQRQFRSMYIKVYVER